MEAPITPSVEPAVQQPVPLGSPEASHRGRGAIIAIVIVVAILAGAGGVAYAAYRGVIQLPFGILAPVPPKLSDIQAAAKTLTSAKITVSMEFEVQPVVAGTPRIEKTPARPKKPGDTTADQTSNIDIYRYLSSDLKLNAELGTRYQTGETTNADGSFKGSYSSSGLTLSLDAAFRRVKDDLYFQINAFPFPIVDIAALAKSWVHVNVHEKAAFSLYNSTRDEAQQVWQDTALATSTNETTTLTEQMSKSSEEWRIVQEELLAHDVFTISNSTLITNDAGKKVWRLGMILHPEQVRAAFVAAVARRPKTGEPRLLTDDMLAYIDRDVFVDWLTSVMAATKSEMDVDAESLIPLSNTFRMLYTTAGPDADKTNPNQYLYTIRYVLSDINVPVEITKPEGALELKQAMRKMLRQSDEEVIFTEQRDIVTDLRDALIAYHADHNAYPAALSDLMGVTRLSRKVVNIPNDRFTGLPFVYARSAEGDSYELVYKIVLPKESQLYTSQYVDGMNTASPLGYSKEAGAKSELENANKDMDGDGLTNAEEKLHHTNSFIKDSDGDGFTDKEEVSKGYDPLTNSKTGAKVGPF